MKKSFWVVLITFILGDSFLFSRSVCAADAKSLAVKRHLVILDAGVDMVFGTYMLAIDNQSEQVSEAEIPIFLPKENIDFRPGEGLMPQDIVLSESGSQIKIRKTFQPGRSLLSLQFTAPAQNGSVKLTFASELPDDSASDFVVMAPIEKMVLSSGDFRLSEHQNFGERRFQVLGLVRDCTKNPCILDVKGIPEGRRRYWILGGVLGVILLVGGGALGFITNARKEDHVV